MQMCCSLDYIIQYVHFFVNLNMVESIAGKAFELCAVCIICELHENPKAFTTEIFFKSTSYNIFVNYLEGLLIC